MDRMESCFVEMDGLRIHYLTDRAPVDMAAPDRPPVLLLHGGGTDSAHLSWALTIPALVQAGLRVFAPDWPGFGQSDYPDAPYSLDYYVGLLPRLMDALGIERASLVGISMGGGVALGCALRYPQRVARLVLVDSYGLQTRVPYPWLSALTVRLPWINEITWAWMARSRAMTAWALRAIFADPSHATPELVDEAWAEVRRPGAGRAWRAFQRNEAGWSRVRTSYLDELGQVSAPVLLVHGARDTLVPLQWAQEAQRRLPNARLEVLPDCGHWAQREQPDVFNRLVAAFLTE